MKSTREEADRIYNLLTGEKVSFESYPKETYEFKLLKLIDILKDDIKDEYYIQRNDVEFWDILEIQNINYIYDKLKSLELYSNAKEV